MDLAHRANLFHSARSEIRLETPTTESVHTLQKHWMHVRIPADHAVELLLKRLQQRLRGGRRICDSAQRGG
eukprot:scaffold7123_cov119-Isochrysis_galbana.AAC.6